MKEVNIESLIKDIIHQVESLIPTYKNSEKDWRISQGHVAMCIITSDGMVYGKLFGSDRLLQRRFFTVAWKKASQVLITGYNTGEYEKTVFGGEMDPEDSLIELPDLIGWSGGQMIKIEGQELAVGFSGFKGYNDLKIVQDAVKNLGID
jgi:glc operon protein GlcG